MQTRSENMKKTIAALMVSALVTLPAMAGEMMYEHMKGHGMISGMNMHKSGTPRTNDPRTSLNLPAPMRRNQLAMMREHLQAVNDIVALIAEGKFDTASQIAHSKLGLTPEMKKMCNMFGNEDFRTMGLVFHKHADELGDVLKTKIMNKSLRALHTTMNACVQCHATFRQ